MRVVCAKTFPSGIEDLQPVVLKFKTNKGAGNRQFPTSQSQRLRKSCVKIGGSLWIICFLIAEVLRNTIHRILTEKLQYLEVRARGVTRRLVDDHILQLIPSVNFFTAMQMKTTY